MKRRAYPIRRERRRRPSGLVVGLAVAGALLLGGLLLAFAPPDEKEPGGQGGGTVRPGELPRVGPAIDATGITRKDYEKGARPWAKLTRIALHQTDGAEGESASAWRNVDSHVGISAGGKIFLLHPLEQLTWSTNALNPSSIAIEVSGHFAGVEGDPKTYRRLVKLPSGQVVDRGPASKLTQAQVTALRKAIAWIVQTVAQQGGKVLEVVAHRQATDTSKFNRRSDPGEAVWRAGAVWARNTLGLSTPLDQTWGLGMPIPAAWDDEASSEY